MKNNNALVLVVIVLSTLLIAVVVKKNRLVNQQPQLPPSIPWEMPPMEKEEETIKTYDDAVESITEKELKENLYYLASDELEGRMSGKKGNIVAAEFIKDKFESYGLKTEYHKFAINRVNPGPKNETGDNFTQNIYAWIEGTEFPEEIIVIGAHMDHIGYGPSMSRSNTRNKIHPGADDNASGTVALLEIAEAFAMIKDKVKRTVVFQAYSAEEMGLIGSRYYCDHPTFPKNKPDIQKHVFMLNMDMVGYLGKGQFFANFYDGESSIDVSAFIEELNKKYSFAKQITGRRSGGSDHASFYNKKVPVAFLHTGSHPHYHTPSDTPDKINYPGIEQVAKYGFELAWKIVQNERAPEFNHASFKEMEYTHDHGHPDMPFWNHSYHSHDH